MRRAGSIAGVILAIASGGAMAGVAVGRPPGPAGATPIGHPGLFNPGQPLHCSGIERMRPPEAARFLEALGYAVTWQVEDRDALTSRQTSVPPATGFIIEGVVHGRAMLLVVEVGSRATPANVASCRATTGNARSG